MARAIVTGASGTVGSVLCDLLRMKGWEVIAWDRKVIPVDDYYKMENFLKLTRPDVLFHLANSSDPDNSWLVNYEWSGELAWLTRILNIKFVFTSTNLVFKTSSQGPFTRESIPNAANGYGFEKRKAEERVFFQNPHATVARLGWQIGIDAGSNDMIKFLERKMKNEGVIRVSTQWLPACSFLQDTCAKLVELATIFSPSLYMIDSNEGWNFFEIATALEKKFNFGWKIEPDNNYVFDGRMMDDRMNMISLQSRIPL